jgi:hypothetical protein
MIGQLRRIIGKKCREFFLGFVIEIKGGKLLGTLLPHNGWSGDSAEGTEWFCIVLK